MINITQESIDFQQNIRKEVYDESLYVY